MVDRLRGGLDNKLLDSLAAFIAGFDGPPEVREMKHCRATLCVL